MTPLSVLASQVWVAFVIECDNEFERRLPHRTTDGGNTAGVPGVPWLVSTVMWWTSLQHVGDEGVTVRALAARARTGTHLEGMERWGYVRVAPDPTDGRATPPRRDWVVRATSAGRAARYVCAPLVGEIEARWRARFGADAVEQLRVALVALVRQLDPALPDCLPILGYGLLTEVPGAEDGAGEGGEDAAALTLPVLLARVVIAFALEFEGAAASSLAISANVLRPLADKPVRVRDLPLESGVSKPAIAIALGLLERRKLVDIGPDPAGGRAKVATLTAAGRATYAAHEALGRSIEAAWRTRYGESTIGAVRDALERLVGAGNASDSPLWLGLEAAPGGWRATVPRPRTLPHFPMVSHRGGYPDGS